MLPPCLRAQTLDHLQALFDLLKGGVLAADVRDLRRLAIGAQLRRQIPRLDEERPQALGQDVQAWIDPGERVQARGGGGHQLGGPGALGGLRGERIGAQAGGGAERVEAAQAFTGAKQLLVLVLGQGGGVDLGQLVLQEVELALAAPESSRRASSSRRRRPVSANASEQASRRLACSGPQRSSRISSWAADRVSLRCSC